MLQHLLKFLLRGVFTVEKNRPRELLRVHLFGLFANAGKDGGPVFRKVAIPAQTPAKRKNQGCTQHSTLIYRNAGVLVPEHHSARNSHVVLVGDSIRVQCQPIELRSTNREMLARVDV